MQTDPVFGLALKLHTMKLAEPVQRILGSVAVLCASTPDARFKAPNRPRRYNSTHYGNMVMGRIVLKLIGGGAEGLKKKAS